MLTIHIKNADTTYTKEDGYVAKVHFAVEGHDSEYEIALQSKRGSDWGYGLFFLNKSGKEEQLLALEGELEENDDLFDQLVQAARVALDNSNE